MQGRGTYDLNVEVTLTEDPFCRLPHDGEGLDLNIVERFTGRDAIPKLGCLGFQVLVGETFELGLRLVDRGDDALELSKGLAFPGTQDLGEDWH
jgi:hypothetical protein